MPTQPRLRIRWVGSELAALLEALGLAVRDDLIELASARIEFVRAGRNAGVPRLDVEELRLTRGPARASSAAIDVAAVGWATVDLDRAEPNVAAGVGRTFNPAGRDRLLGATVRRSSGRRPEILLLEPDTEGRLAGALARYGEGPIALYLRLPELATIASAAATRLGHGPLGPARLLIGGPPAGPFVIFVGPAPGSDDRVPSEP